MIDVNSQVTAVSRELRSEEIDGAPARVQSLSQEYPAAIDDVWEAATSADRIARWFLPVSGELRLGGRYQLEGNAGGEVLECTPPADGRAEYRVTWEFGGGVTWVTVRLVEQGPERTRFELEHVAKTADVPAEMWDVFGPGATGVGWDGGLLGLALHLGTQSASLSPAEAQAWRSPTRDAPSTGPPQTRGAPLTRPQERTPRRRRAAPTPPTASTPARDRPSRNRVRYSTLCRAAPTIPEF